jgi:hypothetical protein
LLALNAGSPSDRVPGINGGENKEPDADPAYRDADGLGRKWFISYRLSNEIKPGVQDTPTHQKRPGCDACGMSQLVVAARELPAEQDDIGDAGDYLHTVGQVGLFCQKCCERDLQREGTQDRLLLQRDDQQ